MKALTICQPYAWLIQHGEKRVENRTWRTNFRGQLAIHAGSSRDWIESCPKCDGSGVLDVSGMTGACPACQNCIFGAVVAIGVLAECMALDVARSLPATHRFGWVRRHAYTEGPYLWILEDVQPLLEPKYCRGAQGLWDWDGMGTNKGVPAKPERTLFS